MAADCPVEAAVRERVAVAETLLQTVVRSVEKLVITVETLAERVNQERGHERSRFCSGRRLNAPNRYSLRSGRTSYGRLGWVPDISNRSS